MFGLILLGKIFLFLIIINNKKILLTCCGWVSRCLHFTLTKGTVMKKITLNICVLNDCRDEDARLRQIARYAANFPGSNISFAGVSNSSEAAFLIVSFIDALDGNPGVVMSNVAPRNGRAKKHANGTPFGLVRVGNCYIFASIDGDTLRILNKLRPGLTLYVYDIPTVVPYLTDDVDLQQKIINTQFRSLEFLPRVAKAVLLEGKTLPSTPVLLSDHCGNDDLGMVAFIDCFGNLKTTLLPEDVGFVPGEWVSLEVGGKFARKFKCYQCLKDIPDGEIGLTIGSSGLDQHRFLEIMCQGESASKRLDVKVGTSIRLKNRNFPALLEANELIPEYTDGKGNKHKYEVSKDVLPSTSDVSEWEYISLLQEGEVWLKSDQMLQRAFELGGNLGLVDAKRMLANEDKIPVSLRGFKILFPGTILSDSIGHWYTACIYFRIDHWVLDFKIHGERFLESAWGDDYRLARSK